METKTLPIISTLTPTELLKLINDFKAKHEELKKEIIEHTFEIENIENLINQKVDRITNIENDYVLLMEELNNRKPETQHNI